MSAHSSGCRYVWRHAPSPCALAALFGAALSTVGPVSVKHCGLNFLVQSLKPLRSQGSHCTHCSHCQVKALESLRSLLSQGTAVTALNARSCPVTVTTLVNAGRSMAFAAPPQDAARRSSSHRGQTQGAWPRAAAGTPRAETGHERNLL